jgi:hypothetical protein
MAADAKPSFWTTLPGVLTGIAAVLTAATGAYLALHKAPTVPKAGDSVPAPPREPAFLRQGTFPQPELAELVLAPPPPEVGDSSTFLRLTDASFGTLDTLPGAAPSVFRFEFILTNTTGAPITLDLTSRFFTLDDDRGRAATLLFFCCPARGALLAPGQARTMVLYFESRDWYGKSVQAHLINLRVTGLLPIERARWHLRPLVTAD